jgi:retinol dehydrogenase 12
LSRCANLRAREPDCPSTGSPSSPTSCNAQELARRLADTGVTTYSLHPGAVASDVWRSIPWPIRPLIKLAMRSPQEGAKTSVYCATSAEVAAQTGLYYQDCREKTPGEAATPELGAELWKRSEGWVATAAA